MTASPSEPQIARFRADLQAIGGPRDDGRLGLAVSGGPDSLALLLLTHAAFPGRVAAATVDHGLRPEATAEADQVHAICGALGVPHEILRIRVEPGTQGIQAAARKGRYAALIDWCRAGGMASLLTAHHRDDQAETVLMRLARGAGIAGLAGIRPRRALAGDPAGIIALRPLLGWSKEELIGLVAAAGLKAADDPSNRDLRYDRTRARHLLRSADWLDPRRLAAVADHARDAEDALDWAARQAFETRCTVKGDALLLDASGLPREIRRRLLKMAFRLGFPESGELRGPELDRLMIRLDSGLVSTLSGVKIEPGAPWRLRNAPPHHGK
ncbi:tRNA lysidine(34) synthetase TilS [Sphingomonas oleivorans]|nr:tRNA lysidine(34) synthetase TilS [Sphingomonas oleivorans]